MTPYDGITAFVASASAWPPDHPTAHAGVAAGVTKVVVQFGDPRTDSANVHEITAARWRHRWNEALGDPDGVEKWWRVNHLAKNEPPHLEFDWRCIANPEDDDEVRRIDALLDAGVDALFLLGKPNGPVPIHRINRMQIPVFAECFRMGPDSDHTIGESRRFFSDAGLGMQLWRPALQAFGEPFAPLGVQARQAKEAGAFGIGVFTAENVSEHDWNEIREGWH